MSAPRPSRPGDEPGLRRLWQQVFGDSQAFLDLFFREIYVPGMARLIEEDGEIVSAAYCVPFGQARYIYAVATAPEHRGRGYGRAVTLAAAEGQGAYLAPATIALRRWYADTMGAVPADCRGEARAVPPLTPLAPEDYARRREELLSGVPHASYSPGILALFALNGGFYADARGALCAVETDGAVREMLPAPPGSEPYLYALNGAPPLHWGLTLE